MKLHDKEYVLQHDVNKMLYQPKLLSMLKEMILVLHSDHKTTFNI